MTADSVVPDPFNPQSLNRYSFAFNNPVAYVDPDGHCPIEPGSPPCLVDPHERLDPNEGPAPIMVFEPLDIEARIPPMPRDPTLEARCRGCSLDVGTLSQPWYDTPEGPSVVPHVPYVEPLPIGFVLPLPVGPTISALPPGYVAQESPAFRMWRALAEEYPGITPEMATIVQGLRDVMRPWHTLNALGGIMVPPQIPALKTEWAPAPPRYPLGTGINPERHNLRVYVPQRSGGTAGWQEVSGNQTPAQKQLGRIRGMFASHTEQLALSRPEFRIANLDPTEVVEMYGQLPPCTRGLSCTSALSDFAEAHRVFILYSWRDAEGLHFKLFSPSGE